VSSSRYLHAAALGHLSELISPAAAAAAAVRRMGQMTEIYSSSDSQAHKVSGCLILVTQRG